MRLTWSKAAYKALNGDQMRPHYHKTRFITVKNVHETAGNRGPKFPEYQMCH